MFMRDLPNLQSFSMDDLPISLKELIVYNVGMILWNTTWELHTSLSVLGILGADNVKALMKMDAPRLPASLVSLYIHNFGDITFLDGKWLQHLTSLQKLFINDAPKLMSFPEEGLPSSLQELHITDCPLLEASLLKKRGKERCKISHIPLIFINNQIISFI
ncbi:putative leucine-rich repeat domain, L domain-containing protein [Medicago truncatula]|uniref:Putative leucine-rich repeat domain, L domain-containing protein n=1 Tax=Medicago truncatula TaxID=3880 RepID=A0A396IRT6_MEDTR|nr:putative leucine-rich repeat domain, L domain-containing protein [Medicago truncatula]